VSDKKRRGAGAGKTGTAISKEQMIKALEVASYLVPAGAAFNAIRLGYKALKAGKKVTQFVKQAEKGRDADKAARKAGQITQGEQKAANVARTEKAQNLSNKATKARDAASKAATATVPTTVAGGMVASKARDANKKSQTSQKTKTGGSTTAADRASAIRNSGQTLAKKAKVAPKTIVGNEYSSKLKRNLSDFEQAYINARREGKKTFKFDGKTISSDLETRPMKKSK
jgi:hypothetical protein